MESSRQGIEQVVLPSADGAVLVNLPDPARYALHKVLVAGERRGVYGSGEGAQGPGSGGAAARGAVAMALEPKKRQLEVQPMRRRAARAPRLSHIRNSLQQIRPRQRGSRPVESSQGLLAGLRSQRVIGTKSDSPAAVARRTNSMAAAPCATSSLTRKRTSALVSSVGINATHSSHRSALADFSAPRAILRDREGSSSWLGRRCCRRA